MTTVVGASNALAAFVKYAGKVPPQSLVVLLYMAVVSKDADKHPWYGQGHEALAQHALGRPGPTTDTDLRAVERAIQPLLGDALIVDRRAAVRIDGPNTVRYRLNLLGDAHARRKPSGVKAVEDPPRPTESVPDARRFSSSRPTVSGTHARRNSSDIGDTRRHEEQEEEEVVGSTTDLAFVAANAPIDEPKFPPLPPKCPHGLAARRLPSGESSCALCRHTAQVLADAPNVIPFRREA